MVLFCQGGQDRSRGSAFGHLLQIDHFAGGHFALASGIAQTLKSWKKMTTQLRKTHRMTWVILAILLPALVIAAYLFMPS